MGGKRRKERRQAKRAVQSDLEEQRVHKLELQLEAKELECDLQGELIQTYRQQVRNLLAALTLKGKHELGITFEENGKDGDASVVRGMGG